ncbi:c-type cytochrome [Ketogulonicigenium vulgare]|uniref:c-type cytochrome n=1 Tax=Ketogulonicigenium vulgare TaxID=92945 RepID=UPI00235A19FA|nr:cytochrome c [Ketogulonicigenium vulgare]
MRSLVLIAASCILATATAAAADDSQRWFESGSKLTQQTGEGIYNAVCAGCHMPDGAGAVGGGLYPALAGNAALTAPDRSIYITLHGQGAMPPLGALLDDQQVADVVNYIRTAFGNAYADPAATPEMVSAAR